MNGRAEARQVKRLFAGGIASADHHERPVAEDRQRAVAGCAVGHALRFQQSFAGHAKMPMARPGGNDDGLRLDALTVNDERNRAFGQIRLLHNAKTGARAETFGLFLHSRHQFVAVHAIGKAGIIFDDAGGGEQAAGLLAGEHERLEIGARGVKRRRPARASRTDDDHFLHKPRKVMRELTGCKLERRLVSINSVWSSAFTRAA